MGFLADYCRKDRVLWDRAFGTTKETQAPSPRREVNDRGRSASNDAATRRLLQALRSDAPGVWTDDRYEASRHWTGIVYLAGHRKCEQMAQSDFQVYRSDPDHPDGKRPVTRRDTEAYRLVQLLERPNHDDSFGDMLYCFPAGTRIRMADGSQKSIEQVHLLDEVLTAEGNVRKVRQCHSREYQGELVRLKLYGHSHLRMTPNHKVLTQRGYIAVEELTKEDWVRIPKYAPATCSMVQTAVHARVGSQKIVNVTGYLGEREWGNYRAIPDFIKLTPGVGRIFGYYLAEGFAAEGKSTVTWSFGTHEADSFVADLVELLRDEWGLEATTSVANSRGTVTLVTIYGTLWVQLFRSLCGVKAKGKRVHSDLLAGPPDFLESLFDAWIAGDGCTKKNNRCCGATVSHDLALNMYDVANYLGWNPTIMWEKATENPKPCPWGIGGRSKGVWKVGAQTEPYQSKSVKARNNYRLRVEDHCIWRKVRELVKESFDGNVFNIGVDGDNSYVAESVGTHNCWSQQMDLTGSALTWMVESKLPSALEGKGLPMELYPVPTATMVPQAVMSPEFPEGFYRAQPLFPYGPFSSQPTPMSSVGAPIDARWVLKFRFPHPLLRYEGYAPLTGIRLHADEVESIDRSRWYKMKRSVNPAAVMNFSEVEGMEIIPDPEIARIHAEWENSFQGPENHGRLIVGIPGSTIEEFGTRPVDMEYQAGWEQLVSFVMAALGITKPAAGMIEDASYATLFATLKQLHLLTLKPMCERFSAKLTRHLASFFGDDLIVEIRCPRIDDHDVKNAKLSLLAQNKAITVNELRKELDMPLTKEEWGEERCGEQPQGQEGQQPGMPGAGPEQPPEKMQTADAGMKPANDAMTDASGDKLAEEEIARHQPKPGNLGRGALGPRKSLSLNGNGKNHLVRN